MTFPLTDEQLAIQSAIARGDHVLASALAGTGKTSTICASIPKGRRVLLLAFNRKVKEELESRLRALVDAHVLEIKTMNGLGHSAIGKAIRKRCEVDGSKLFKLCKDLELSKDDKADVQELVEAARNAGMIPKGSPGKGLFPDTDLHWEEFAHEREIDPMLIIPARKVLKASFNLALSGSLDFTDQIYISALVFGSFPLPDTVIVDEAQDLSPLNHAQLRKLGKSSQLVAIGDPNQAIYAFRGADANSMTNLEALRPEWTHLPLTLTFRCPKQVVARLSAHAPGFRAAPTNPAGTISFPSPWSPRISSSTAIICRNNAPLLRLAFRLTAAKIPVNLQGRDMGKTLKRLYKKLPKGPIAHQASVARKKAEEDEVRSDQWECLAILLESSGGSDIEGILAEFARPKDGAPNLLTGHKSKGLEWPQVYHLDPDLIGKYAETEVEERQEANLRYVIESRTSQDLFLVQSKDLLVP